MNKTYYKPIIAKQISGFNETEKPTELKKFSHLMVDIETMGHRSSSAIVSIGAVEFDIESGETGKEFYKKVSLQSCVYAGLKITAETVMWWMEQNEQARMDLLTDTYFLHHVLIQFAEFCNNKYQVWGNSARFDFGILEDAHNAVNLPIPWDFRKERCVRTLVSFCPQIKNSFVYTGTAHNALADCYNQIGYCTKIWTML